MKMAEYIDREEYCEKHCRCSNEYCDKESGPIWKAPAADVEPVRRGAWEDRDVWYGMVSGRCPYCGLSPSSWHIELPYTYCPYCGAKLGIDTRRKEEAHNG